MNIIKALASKVIGLDMVKKIAVEEIIKININMNLNLSVKVMYEHIGLANVKTSFYTIRYGLELHSIVVEPIIFINPVTVRASCLSFGLFTKEELRPVIKALILHEVGHYLSFTEERRYKHLMAKLQEINGWGCVFGFTKEFIQYNEQLADDFAKSNCTEEEWNIFYLMTTKKTIGKVIMAKLLLSK